MAGQDVTKPAVSWLGWPLTEYFLGADLMMRQPCVWASRASPGQKLLGLKVVLFQKVSKGYIFCFPDHSVGQYMLFALEMNLEKKRSVKL